MIDARLLAGVVARLEEAATDRFPDPLDFAFGRFLAQSEHSPLTIRNYRSDLDAFAAWFEGANGEAGNGTETRTRLVYRTERDGGWKDGHWSPLIGLEGTGASLSVSRQHRAARGRSGNKRLFAPDPIVRQIGSQLSRRLEAQRPK